jgi:hypothetical protein
MGLFSALGFGGGKLDLQLKGKQVTAGSELQGRVTFKAGKRQQEVKAITANVRVTTYKMQPGPNGPQRNSQTDTLVKDKQISGPFVSHPGNSYDYEFTIPLPADLYNSDADVEYRLGLSADIDGEVDPGDGEPFTVVGGKPFPKAVLPTSPPVPAQPVGASASLPGQGLAVGAGVLAQWTDGSWQQAKVISSSGNLIAVDWVDPGLGASMWLQSHQVLPAAAPAGPPMAPPFVPGQLPAQPAAPQAFQAQPGAGQPFVGQQGMGQPVPGQAFAGQQMMGQPIPGQAFAVQPVPGQPMMAMPVPQQTPGVGARVLAQWTDGNWYPGTVVQVQGSLVGVDWEDPRLGASAWVQAHQVQAR